MDPKQQKTVYYTCYYCGKRLPNPNKNVDNILNHACFIGLDVTTQCIRIGDNNKVFAALLSNEVDESSPPLENNYEVGQNENSSINSLAPINNVEFSHPLVNNQSNDDSSNQGESFVDMESSPGNVRSPMTNDEIEQLIIVSVKEHPCIWNHTIPVESRTKLKKQQAWKKIAEDMGLIMTVEAIQKKWESIRKDFINVRNTLRSYQPSGSAARSNETLNAIKKQCTNYDLLEFLSDTTDPVPTDSSPLPPSNQNNNNLPERNDEYYRNMPNKRQKKGDSKNDSNDDIGKIIDFLQKTDNKEDPAIDPFLMQIKYYLKKLEETALLDTQLKILTLINQQLTLSQNK